MDQRIGAQLYTLRDFCKTKEDLDATCARLQEIGYKHIQISGIGPISAPDVRAIADKYGMVISCTHRDFNDYENNFQAEVDYHKTIGCDIVGVGALPNAWSEEITKEKVVDFIKRMNKVYDNFKKEGLTLAYHNHAFEFEKFDGKYLMDLLIEEGKFDFILDTYWLAYAGINPADFIRKLGKRAVAVHFKDLAIVQRDIVMAEITYGNLDWDEIIAACNDAGVQWALVEQDTCQRDPFESMKMSYDALTQKGFI